LTRALKWLAILLIVAGAGAAWLVAAGVRSLDAPLQLAAPLRYKVGAGASFAHIAAELGAQGVVAHPRAWVLYARYAGLAASVKAGVYEIEPGTTPRSLLAKFVKGEVLMHSFTIIDGWRVADLLAALRRSPDVGATLTAGTKDLMAKIGAPGLEAEGQFLPETYRFPDGATDVEVLQLAHAALQRELDAAWKDRDPNLPLHDPKELLIMASIVEKETGVPAELPKVAGLYLHRLNIGMRLQADPTVIYGLGDDYDGSIHTVDLRTDGPYNTYTRAGLPPTPIALPGAAAIRATAHPETTEALYFVASARGDGTHEFSATLDQQNAAVARYLAHLRKRTAEGAH
jgi:UPF0755 protein